MEIQTYSLDQLKEIKDDFTSELVLSRDGVKTSLPFIRIPLPHHPLVRDDQVFQVMVIGGSKFKKALARQTDEGIVLMDAVSEPLPTLASLADLGAFIISHLDDGVKLLSVNFAQAMDPVLRENVLDGVVITVAKEQGMRDLFGKQLGVTLETMMRDQLKREVQVSIANDTLCLAMSRAGEENSREKLVSGVVGTGINFGLFLDKDTFVNLEAASFDKFTPTMTGERIDQASSSPGEAKLEKEIAGAYLYRHYNLLVDELQLAAPHMDHTDEMNIFAREGEGVDSELACKLLERSAMLTAAVIAAIYEFKNQHKLIFVMEGSLFWRAWRYKEVVEEYIEKLGVPSGAIRFVHVQNSSLMGAAGVVTGPVKKRPAVVEPEPEAEAKKQQTEAKAAEH